VGPSTCGARQSEVGRSARSVASFSCPRTKGENLDRTSSQSRALASPPLLLNPVRSSAPSISSSGGCPRALDFVQRRLAARWRRKAATERWWRLAALALDFVRASSGGGREQKRRAGGGRQQSSDGGGGWTVRALDFFLGTPGVEMLSVASIVGRLASPRLAAHPRSTPGVARLSATPQARSSLQVSIPFF
jgi:hypothetical protein